MKRVSVSILSMAAILGVLPLLILPALPASELLWAGLSLSCIVWLNNKSCWFAVIAVALFSFCWAGLTAQTLLKQVDQLAQGTVDAVVAISSVSFAGFDENQVLVRLEKVNQRWVFPPLYAQITLANVMRNWCGGQRWAVTAQLRPVHSRLNEGGFDRQRWEIAKRQPLAGKILSARIMEAECDMRQRVILQAERQTATLPWRAILLALAFGEMKTVDPKIKARLQQTGTMHLMSISGLHIALAAGFGWLLARAIQFGLPVHWIGYRLPLLTSVLIAWGYVWLAGGNPPAVRAALALSVWLALKISGVLCSPWQVWLWCVAMILLCDPISVLSDSFWLSCLAVAALIFWFQWAPLPVRCQTRARWFWLRWIHLQTGITLLLMPLQLALFHGFSLMSLPANLWAVPVVSFITTPLVLLALPLMSLPALSDWLWRLGDWSLNAVFVPLSYLQSGWVYLDGSLLIGSLTGWMMVAVWRFAWWKSYPGTLGALIVLLMVSRMKNDSANWRVDMLDVGHGLAIVIERNGKAVLYDTGSRWPGGDMATREILPYLRWRGLSLEKIILSHGHMDHAGGLEKVRQAYPSATVYRSYNQPGRSSCSQGDVWNWQGLTFTVLWPTTRVAGAENNDSCVIRIDDGKYRVLLTGDIESEAEKQLIKWQRGALAADLLQIPHHGSKTSSSPPFIRAVNARYVAASAARYNPWRLPSIKIVERYRQQGYEWLDTATSGQLSARFYNDSWRILRFRQQISPRWYHQWFGVKRYNE
ncbi:competence protein ComEC|uniref:Competence protein ComEC n=1 Tax=Brenneria salicis ATCC 15712 = DSM 30166 TaxID=714314 RepID=A0A366I2D2_9GAMM|nr:ComEC family protein [Brenneria salicis]NMN91398.1 competence protein ComEC [Brenneria salicis ATCC 15712 = DSM 30166]RBP61760.1 competence protein ComEC [Brenneria salicis ATCC 15712 = DSM 30166]RLM30491.1 ComEC family protein [Brenneria salicis ATCC 15712 = DSM 30166]